MAAPANDNFADATVLSGASGSVSGTTVEATMETDEPYGPYDKRSVWYAFTPPTSGLYRWTLTLPVATGQYITLACWTDAATLAEVTQVVIGGENASSSLLIADVSEPGWSTGTTRLTAGTTYKVQVWSYIDGGGDRCGPFQVEWGFIPAPANDDVQHATVLLGSGGTFSGTCLAATPQPGDTLDPDDDYTVNWDTHGASSVWYKFTPPTDGLLRFETADVDMTDPDARYWWAVLCVCKGTYPDSFTQLTGNDWGGYQDAYTGNWIRNADIECAVEAGVAHYIGVAEDSGSFGYDDRHGGDFIAYWKFIPTPAPPTTLPVPSPIPGVHTHTVHPGTPNIVVPTDMRSCSMSYILNFDYYTFDSVATVGDETKFFLGFETEDGTLLKGLKFKCVSVADYAGFPARQYAIVDESGAGFFASPGYSHGLPITILLYVDSTYGPAWYVQNAYGGMNSYSVFSIFDAGVTFNWAPAGLTASEPIAQVRLGQFGSGAAIPVTFDDVTSQFDGTAENPYGPYGLRTDFETGASLHSEGIADPGANMTTLSSTAVMAKFRGSVWPPPDDALGVFYSDTTYSDDSTLTVRPDGLAMDGGAIGAGGGVDIWHGLVGDDDYGPSNTYVPDNLEFQFAFRVERWLESFRLTEGDERPYAFFDGLGMQMDVSNDDNMVFFSARIPGAHQWWESGIIATDWWYRMRVRYERLYDTSGLPSYREGMIPGRWTVDLSRDGGATWTPFSAGIDDFRATRAYAEGEFTLGMYDAGTFVIGGFSSGPPPEPEPGPWIPAAHGTVVCYCLGDSAFLDDDVAVTRRMFMELGYLSADHADVLVEVLDSAESVETEMRLAKLPFPDGQTVYTSPPTGRKYRAQAGWYGTSVEDNRGAFCLVRAGGPLAGLAGRRLRFTRA